MNALTGELLRKLGTGVAGSGLGQWNNPYGVAIQPPNAKYRNGVVYVTESTGKRVVLLDANSGEYIGLLAGVRERSFTGICACSDTRGNNLVFVSNNITHMVEIYVDE